MEYNESLNMFTKGIVADLDPLMVGQDQWVFPTLNIRVMNKDGQGIIATVIEGNDIEFALNSGFLALGACQYNGVAYIVSYNESTGDGEIGCFPSPRDIDATYSFPNTLTPPPDPAVFQRQYRPLLNYTALATAPGPNDQRVILRSSAFNFDLEHQVSMFAKESYDGSVDLYLADYKNINRVINSGFNQDGEFLNRLYFINNFTGSMNQIQVQGTVLEVDLNSIPDGGYLEYGIYFASFRYSDASHNVTTFIATSNACQIFYGNLNGITEVVMLLRQVRKH
jgi:hypothetical protein